MHIKLRFSHLHDLLLVGPELRGVGHVLVGHPDHVGGDPADRHPEHDEQLHDVAGLQGVDAEVLRAIKAKRDTDSSEMGRAGAREESETRCVDLTSSPDLRPYPRRVTPTPISSTSFLEYPNSFCGNTSRSFSSFRRVLETERIARDIPRA